MNWRPIDFQGLIDLDPAIVEQLEEYLQEKESRLAQQILSTLHLESVESSIPILPIGKSMKLSDAVEAFAKQARLFQQKAEEDKNSKEKIHQFTKEINRALWEYTEVLEGCVIELFQQVRQIPIDRWHLSLLQAVQKIKDILFHRIEDLNWTIRRLEKPLKEFCTKMQPKSILGIDWRGIGRTYLDSSLEKNLIQTEKVLKTGFNSFKERYDTFISLSIQVEELLEKMKTFPVLDMLDMADQNLYVDVFRLLKMLEINPHPKKIVGLETGRALKHLTSIDNVFKVFLKYFQESKHSFFNCSLELKSLNPEEDYYQEACNSLHSRLDELQQELQQLLLTMRSYRTFILKNDSNPYVRTSLGFKEWIVGPEPAKAKQMANLIFAADELNTDFLQFSKKLTRDPHIQQNLEYRAHEEIDRLLHEMGQPLISRSMMQSRAEQLLEALNACDEIGSPQISTIFYFEDILSKAMRVDWKYHVLHEFPLFHKIYRLHKGLEEIFDDNSHKFRIERFQNLFAQIQEWVNRGDVYAHVHEIELDMNDMKTYLQDFLASIQRAEKDKSQDPFLEETVNKFSQELLEYRYLFGQFFSGLMNKSSDCRQLRHQFLFVDQYFETSENLLKTLKR